MFDGVGMSQTRGGYGFALDEECLKFLSWKEEHGTYFVIDTLSYLSYQIKWYEQKSLLTYFVAYTDYSAKGVLLDWLATICIINFLSLFTSFEQSQPFNNCNKIK